MKHRYQLLISIAAATLAFVTACLLPAKAVAQTSDTLDVAPGYQTLNVAILGDTTASGAPKDTSRVYRLQRGGVYLLNGTISNVKASTLRIVAASGTAAMPILIEAVQTSGSSAEPFIFTGNAYLKGLYVTGVNNIGNLDAGGKNMLRMNGAGMSLVVDGCFLDYETQSFVRMNAANQSVAFYNSQLRNSVLSADPGNGRFVDTRGNIQTSIILKNSTFYVGSDQIIRDGGNVIKNVTIDHCTFYQCAGYVFYLNGGNICNSVNYGVFSVSRCVTLAFTNNLLINCGYEGVYHPKKGPLVAGDTINEPFICIDSLKAPTIASESQRRYTITNNVWGYTSQLLNFFASTDTVKAFVFLNKYDSLMIKGNSNFVAANNLNDTVAFSNAPKNDSLLAYIKYQYSTGFSNAANPNIYADENGVAAFSTAPATFGTGPNPYTFGYASSFRAYTYAADGGPVGDLTWFGKVTDVQTVNSSIPSNFSLSNNYPNPFNPSTSLEYSIPSRAHVVLEVFNVLGQSVAQLVDREQSPGTYKVTFDASKLSSGVYLYRLQAGSFVQTRKMVLTK